MFKSIESPFSYLLISLFFVFVISILLNLGGCSANHYANGKQIQNVSDDFRVGGFFGTSYLVKIKDSALSYRTYSQGITSEWQKQTFIAEDIEN